jgi:Putative peptidoglycan binding domain
MKTLLLLAFSLTTALTQIAKAEDQNQVVKAPNKRPQAPVRRVIQTPRVRQPVVTTHAPHVNTFPRVNTGPRVNTLRRYQPDQVRSLTPRVRTNPNVVTTPQTPTTVQSDVNARNRFDRTDHNRFDRTDRNRFDRNRTTTNANVNANRTRQNFNHLNWADARRNRDRNRHDRGWWRSHFTRFVLFGGGYYYWNSGYWYPAYGYDDAYNSYSYDEPIYGYEDQDPSQTISGVQTELQRLGYYKYAVDGTMGPATRAAIANYQRDNGLSITSAIDEPTLQSLGLG